MEEIYYLKTLRKGMKEEDVAAGKSEWQFIKVDASNVALYLEDENDVWEHSNADGYEEWKQSVMAYHAKMKELSLNVESMSDNEAEEVAAPEEEVSPEAPAESVEEAPAESEAPAEESSPAE